jgi:hypothetical protein
VKYGQLTNKHAEYDPDGAWKRLRLLFKGGYQILKKCNAELFLPKAPNETADRYAYRLQITKYVNHLASVLGYLTGSLFLRDLEVHAASDSKNPDTPGELPADFFREFAADCDQSGTGFSDFLRATTLWALLLKRAVVGVDLPPGAPEAETRAQEEATGAGRAYLYAIPVERLTDWTEGQGGKLSGAVLHDVVEVRDSIKDEPGMIADRFRVWSMMPDGFAHWMEYQTKPRKKKDPVPQPTEDVPQTVAPTKTSFRRLPIQVLKLPDALWAGGEAGPLAEEVFQRRSEINGSLSRNLNPTAYIKRGSEIGAVHGALPSETQQNPTRGDNWVESAERKGFVPLGADDEIGFVEPPSGALEMASRERDQAKQDLYSVVHAMAMQLQNSAGAMQRSGESKREDRQATGMVLDALGSLVRPFAVGLYETVGEARGERETRWTTDGLDAFDREDRGARVEEAVDVESLEIPSPTFNRAYKKQTAFTLLPDASAADKAQIAQEIDENMSDEQLAADEERDRLAAEAARLALQGGMKEPDEDHGAGSPKTGGMRTPVPPKTSANGSR